MCVVRADAETHPDLFWAIRGGGGNFGVATRFEFRTHPVDRMFGGTLILPATPEVITSFVGAASDAPDELSTIATVMMAPSMPPELFMPEEPGFHPTMASDSFFLDRFDRGIAETILEHLGTSTALMTAVQLRVLGGAMARIPEGATAFAHRNRRILVAVGAMFEASEDGEVHHAWVDRVTAALRRDEGVYSGFLGAEREARVRAAYPGPTWDRLVEIKGRYDPHNLFRLNQNIPPEVLRERTRTI